MAVNFSQKWKVGRKGNVSCTSCIFGVIVRGHPSRTTLGGAIELWTLKFLLNHWIERRDTLMSLVISVEGFSSAILTSIVRRLVSGMWQGITYNMS